MKVRLIQDPVYLARQTCVAVPAHQVRGLLPIVRMMVFLCRDKNLPSLSAPQVGVYSRFFIARSFEPNDPDFDTVFNPVYTPIEKDGMRTVEEIGEDLKVRQAARWRKISMTWDYHNGEQFVSKQGVFEGEAAYLAQLEIDRLNGLYRRPLP